jgi:hypothetical protein
MKTQTKMILLAIIMIAGCNVPPPMEKKETGAIELSIIDQSARDQVISTLIDKYGESLRDRITRGVKQAADLWNASDGDAEAFKAFCSANFIAGEAELDLVFNRLSAAMESLGGCYNKISVDLKLPMHLDIGPMHAVDEILGSYSPGAHLTDDFFANKLAFIVLLNFPLYSLEEKTANSASWTRKQWAYARMGEMFTSRTPAAINQEIATALTMADNYISEYNIYLGKLRNEQGEAMFPEDLRLISHWGIRDELKSCYADPNGIAKQRMIYQVMQRIIRQEIPENVIDNPEYTWDPFRNQVFKDNQPISSSPEPDTRYQVLLNNFLALKKADPYNPFYPNYISRAFDQEMEIPQADVENLFIELLSSPAVKQTGELISKRLGRPLEPFDIWYDGFKTRSTLNEDDLNKITRAKYPDSEAFQADLANILVKLGFPKDSAEVLADRIKVDAARGSGHAWGAEMRTDKARLRTRIGQQGMDYKGYNIAIHEFGHTVEQTISLYNMDYYVLHGVPNTAFTEALAFLFQQRDLQILGMQSGDDNAKYLMALDNLWMNYEIMGVSLVDMRVWKWLYEHPDASAAQLKEMVLTTAIDVWNKYYAPVFGVNDSPILAIYSHMIDNPLYLSNYPVGHLIQFQIEQYMEGKNLPDEVYRMYTLGLLVPQVWMQQAVGGPISILPSIQAAEEALVKMQ